MPQGRSFCSWTCLVVLTLWAGVAGADTFVNFEEPQTQPIAVVRLEAATVLPTELAGAPATKAIPALVVRDLLVVVNTPDNSVEIYDAGSPWGFVTRLWTGLGPVTVRWNEERERLYVCNFSGDSVAIVHLKLKPQDGSVVATLERIVDVGDEPSDIAFSSDDATAFITLSSQSGVTVRNASNLSVVNAFDRLDLTVGTEVQAVKAPRQIWIDSNDRMMVLNLMGEVADVANGLTYDLDLFVDDPGLGRSQVTGVGSTLHAFALSPDETRMFVVGTRAQHRDPAAVGVAGVSQLVTGFVQSWLFVLDVPAAGTPTLVAEATPGGPWQTFRSVNLNRDYNAVPLTAVPAADALSQPTAVVVVDDGDGGVDKLFLAAFHSDKIARLRPDASAPGGWDVKRIAVPIFNTDPLEGYSVAGPRGLALGRRLKAPGGGNDSFVFVANRLDNTVAVVSVSSEQIVGHFALQNDPTPVVVRRGREHLYDAQGHSGSGTVTCASCHVDARTDGLPWNLGVAGDGPTIPDGFFDSNSLGGATEFPEDKGLMITQTLLGLVNYPTNAGSQFMFTNAPYHWRGDKGGFEDFNEAFFNLQGMPDVGDPGDPKGLSDAEMRDYRDFINTVRHPPNRDQDLGRRQSGTLGDDPNDVTQATGTKLGLVLYHNNVAVDIRACADCHSLPDGSSNTSTLNFNITRTVTTGSLPDPQTHPIETGALRNIRQREMQIRTLTEDTKVANFGLMHDGQAFNAPSLETFVLNTFGLLMPGPDTAGQIVALIEFVQRFDTGIAPAATLAHTLGQPNDTAMLDLLEEQVREANIGLAARVLSGGTVTGYWYDTTVTPAMYREEGTANLIDRLTLEGMAAAGDTVTLQGCPPGTERRWASAAGTATTLTGAAASAITLEPMAPPTQYEDVAGLNVFVWAQQSPPFLPPNSNMWTRDAYQQALIPFPRFGVPGKRHEPPRRFRVTGDDIRPGAMLHLGIPKQAPQSAPVQVVTMELYPTQYRGTGGRQIWETSQEAAPLITLALLNGGFWAPDVIPTFLRTTTTPSLQPVAWNGYLAVIENEDGTLSNNLNDFQVLSVQDGR